MEEIYVSHVWAIYYQPATLGTYLTLLAMHSILHSFIAGIVVEREEGEMFKEGVEEGLD